MTALVDWQISLSGLRAAESTPIGDIAAKLASALEAAGKAFDAAATFAVRTQEIRTEVPIPTATLQFVDLTTRDMVTLLGLGSVINTSETTNGAYLRGRIDALRGSPELNADPLLQEVLNQLTDTMTRTYTTEVSSVRSLSYVPPAVASALTDALAQADRFLFLFA